MDASHRHDVLVVGGGTAGCILASRLSEDQGRSVLLLEAGPDFDGVSAYPRAVLDEHAYPVDYTWRFVGLRTDTDDAPLSVVLDDRRLGQRSTDVVTSAAPPKTTTPGAFECGRARSSSRSFA